MTSRFQKLLVSLLLLLFVSSCQSVTLDDELLHVSLRAMQLSATLFEAKPVVENANIYIDDIDAALFLREDNYCFVAFRGTTRTWRDWMQNLNPFDGSICTPSGQECCKTRSGFQQAYTEPNYKDKLEANVRECKEACPSCQVVIAGHSQGAAVAAVASISLSDLDPTTITFGGPAAIVGRCRAINVDKYYRFMNTYLDSSHDLDYDPVSYLDWNADQLGHLFVMGEDNKNVVYYKDGSGPSAFEFGWHVKAHQAPRYIERLERFQKQVKLGTDGWELGYACNLDEECASNYKCVDNRCYQGVNGDGCKKDSDCDSGRCEGVFAKECKAKLKTGRMCNENADCLSESCGWSFTCS